jgi:hypothetical protein
MRSANLRAVPVLIALATLLLPGSRATAGPNDVTIDPPSSAVNLSLNPSFRVTYGNRTRGGACSTEGNFNTDLVATERGITIGVITRAISTPAPSGGPTTVLERVTIPPAVVEQVRRRGIRPPIYYTRTWRACRGGSFLDITEFPVMFTTATIVAVPGTARIRVGTDTQVPLRWRASFDQGVSTRVESAEGRFLDGRGCVYGSPVRTPLQATGGSPLELGENLVVPQSVVAEVLASGAESALRYERSFTVEGVQIVAALTLNFAGRVASPFAVDRAELRFLDGTRFKIVAPGEEVLAVADVTFSGSGRLQGSWDLAGPSTTPGAPLFVRRELIDEHLSFGQRSLVRSPAIRADAPGTYLLRLSLSEPDLAADDALQVSFVVRATAQGGGISLLQPPPLARLDPALVFGWEAVAGARSIQLELYDTPGTQGRGPVAGMVLPGDTTRTALTRAVLRKLPPGTPLWWRVVASDPDGFLLGQSPLRELLPAHE